MSEIESDQPAQPPYVNLYRKQALDHYRQRFLGEVKVALPGWTRAAFFIVLLCTAGVACYLLWIIRTFSLLS